MDFFNFELATASNEKRGLHSGIQATIRIWRVPRDNSIYRILTLTASRATAKAKARFINFKTRKYNSYISISAARFGPKETLRITIAPSRRANCWNCWTRNKSDVTFLGDHFTTPSATRLHSGVRKTAKNSSHDNWRPGQDSNRTPPGHKSEPLTLQQRSRSVQEFRRRG
jgi:hypothetical protein